MNEKKIRGIHRDRVRDNRFYFVAAFVYHPDGSIKY